LKARGDRVPTPGQSEADSRGSLSSTLDKFELPGDERQQRQARDWVRRGFWLRDGSWGPAPDQPGCNLPPALIAWCLAERAALAAA